MNPATVSASLRLRNSLPRASLIAMWALGVPLAGLLAVPAAAQSGAMVQPLPPAGVADLNSALRRLASNPRNLDALIAAGNASLQLNDIAAAIGFFGRADDLSPGNPRVKVGLAAAFVRSERPLEALRLFDEAERAGASTLSLAADRGLAYDLVGDPVSAQAQYSQAMAVRSNDELIRRMALSQAISGDRPGFEKTLYPLLVKRDFAAYRTRAFGLAILGEESEAVAIAEAVMPTELAARMTPYLRYMGRLTRAQQAAAANLGEFPRAAQIGRDDPRITEYASANGIVPAVRTADASLTPQGQPLGPKPDNSSQRRRPDRGSSKVPKAEKPTRVAKNDEPRGIRRGASSSAPVAAKPAAPVVAPVRQPVQSTVLPPVQTQAVIQPTPAPAAVSGQSTLAEIVERQQSGVEPTQGGELPPVQTVQTVQNIQPSEAARPGFDLESVPVVPATQTAAVVQAVPPQQAEAEPVEMASVADAFAGFILEKPVPSTNGAVDITAIEPPREKAEEPAAKAVPQPAPKPVTKPEPPRNPSRVWVQVATGRDRKALAFDWRKMSRKSPDILGKVKPHLAEWGQTNRLLAGPYDSLKAAQAAVSTLKKEGFDSFTFTSTAGQQVDPLP